MTGPGPLGPLKRVEKMGEMGWRGECPGCGLVAFLDEEQLRGEVSVDCPNCGYHETHDHREEENR